MPRSPHFFNITLIPTIPHSRMVVPNSDRLLVDVIGQLEETVKKTPTDCILWTKLLDQVIIKDKEEQVRSTFDEYLSIFKFDVCIRHSKKKTEKC